MEEQVMTIQVWIIIIESAILVTIVGGGIYFRHFLKAHFSEQLASKDAIIEEQQATIGHLRETAAHHLAQQVSELSRYADSSAEEISRLRDAATRLEKSEDAGKSVSEHRVTYIEGKTKLEIADDINNVLHELLDKAEEDESTRLGVTYAFRRIHNYVEKLKNDVRKQIENLTNI